MMLDSLVRLGPCGTLISGCGLVLNRPNAMLGELVTGECGTVICPITVSGAKNMLCKVGNTNNLALCSFNLDHYY